MSAPFVLPRKAVPSPLPPSSSSHIPSIPSEADGDDNGENSQLMADYLEYPRAYTPPSPYPHGNIGPPRPLEPRRSRASGQTHHSRQPSSGLSAAPMSGPGAGRISTATWISSSQFPPARPAQAVTSDAYDDLDISRPSGELHNNYSYNTSAPAGAHYDDGYNHEPYNAQDEEGYIPDGLDADQQQRPPSAPPTEAEHMTVEAASTTHHAPPTQFNPLPSQTRPKSGSGFGGMFRRAFGLGGNTNTNTQSEDMEARRGYSHPFAPGLQPSSSAKTRQVTYVDPPGTALGDQSVYDDPAPAASRPSADRTAAHTHSSQHSMSDGGRREPEDEEDMDELDGSTANAPHTAPRRPGPAPTPGPPMGTFMSAHHANGNGMPPGSPVYVEPLPTSDYDKMSAFASSPSELHSLLSYVDRVTQFVRDVHELPWMASRVAADYIPGDGARSRYARFRQRHVSGAVPVGGVNSWYATAAHQDLDLLDGASDAGWAGGAGGPAARARQMQMQMAYAANGARLPPGYQNVAYVYPAAYPGQYNDPAGGYGRDSQDVDPYNSGHPRPSGDDGSSDVRVHVQHASTPPPGATAHQVHAHFASGAGQPGSPRPGGPGPAQATAAHTFGSPVPGSPRSLAVTSDKSNSAKATTAYETARTHGAGRTDGGRSEGGRSRGGGTELSAVTANTGTGTGSGLRPPTVGQDGKRKSRVSWYSNNSAGDGGSRPGSVAYGMGSMSPPGSPRASRGWYGQQEPRMGRVPEMSEVGPGAVGQSGVGLGFGEVPRSPPRAAFASAIGSPRRRGFEPERRGPVFAAVR